MDTSISLGVGAIFLSDHPALWIGFIMLMVTPCTDWYRIYRHSKRECVSFNIDSTDQFDPASRTFTYIPTIIRWQH